MDARNVLLKFRQNGFTIKAVGAHIALAPKRLINDPIIAYVRRNKSCLLSALYEEIDEQKERKAGLGDRVQVLRVLVYKSLHQYRYTMSENEFSALVEQHVDEELINHSYDLERSIDHYRDLHLDKNFGMYGVCIDCGYMPPFCSCQKPLPYGLVTCNQCKYFTPDSYGYGGIGKCSQGIDHTQEVNGLMPLFPRAERHCVKFNDKDI